MEHTHTHPVWEKVSNVASGEIDMTRDSSFYVFLQTAHHNFCLLLLSGPGRGNDCDIEGNRGGRLELDAKSAMCASSH